MDCDRRPAGQNPQRDVDTMLLLVAMGELDIARGRTLPQAEVFRRLRASLRRPHQPRSSGG